ncbi:MAG: diguanylate cyclase (GGDEF)-like protein [Oleiphilaceae bacterium]|jgi:diguanylate cyclase (GGDEF)-like protein
MTIQSIFKLLKRLTKHTSVKGLVNELTALLSEHFSGVQFTVCEIQASRDDDSKTQSLICFDCLNPDKIISLKKDKNLNKAYTSAHEVRGAYEHNKQTIIFPVVLYDKSISHLISIAHVYPEGNGADLLIGLMQIFTDIFRSLHEKSYDPLTRILNRQAFDQVATDLSYKDLSLPTSGTERSFKAIAILDIDKFKLINDNFGHAIGDETLVLFAQTIRSVLRQDDLFFRYGGEEFVVLVKQAHSEEAFTALERCREAIEARRFPQVGKVTVSIGYAELSPKSQLATVLSKADKALYYIKNHGRNQVKSYDHLLKEGLLEEVKTNEGTIDFWD